MGQPIRVTSQPGSRPEVMIFSLNRSLTGMRVEDFHDPAAAEGTRWVDEVARRLGAIGATQVTVFMSQITAEAPDWSGLREEAERVITELYLYWTPGRPVPDDAELMAAADSQ